MMPGEEPIEERKKRKGPLKMSPEEFTRQSSLIREGLKQVGQQIEIDERNWQTKGTTGDPKKDEFLKKIETFFADMAKKNKTTV